MKKLTVLISVFLFLTGCANISKPVDKNVTATKSITIVPTGKIIYETSSNRGGASFGLLGALVEHAVTKDGNMNSTKVLEKEIPQEEIFNIATDEFKKNLSNSKQSQIINIANRVLANSPSQDWYKNEHREHLTKNPNLQTDLALEISLPRIGISKEFGGYYATGFMNARVIDLKNGSLIGSASAFNVGMTSGIPVNSDESKSDYSQAIKRAFITLVKSLSDQVYKKLYTTE